MNKRQKKKQFKSTTGINPPKDLRFCSEHYHNKIKKIWGGSSRKERIRQQEIKNLERFNYYMTEKRKKGRKCKRQSIFRDIK